MATYAQVRSNATEAQVASLGIDADVLIDTARNTPEDVVVRTEAYLGLGGIGSERLVDVLVGGEFGSEGKGNIAAFLAREYGLLVRVGGPNAGHRVSTLTGTEFTHRHLPSGTRFSDARLLIGPGAVLNVDVLLNEISECGLDIDRLTIDPAAMVISQADIRKERQLVTTIGSTGQGVGTATARRITGRRGGVQLAEDIKALKPFLRPAQDVYAQAYASRTKIMLEGTQGTGLSLFHGSYPHVTSRDTTSAACLSEAGIAPAKVRRVVMVCRTYPIRVQSPTDRTSGPMSQEISWTEVARRSGHNPRTLLKHERGSVSGKTRRVSEFDWVLLRRAATINGATDVALTFADYLDKANEHARRFEQLTIETLRFIEEMERVARAPVTLISTRFHFRSVIDRRSW